MPNWIYDYNHTENEMGNNHITMCYFRFARCSLATNFGPMINTITTKLELYPSGTHIFAHRQTDTKRERERANERVPLQTSEHPNRRNANLFDRVYFGVMKTKGIVWQQRYLYFVITRTKQTKPRQKVRGVQKWSIKSRKYASKHK